MIYNGKRYRAKTSFKAVLFSLIIIGVGMVEGATGFAGIFIGGFVGIGSGLLLMALCE